MRKILPLLLTMFLSLFALGQTSITLTTTEPTNCGKANWYCSPAATDGAGAGYFTVDSRRSTLPYQDRLTISMPDFTGSASGPAGSFSEVGDNPDGSRNPFDTTRTYSGSGVNVDPDGTQHPFTVTATFLLHAYRVNTCSGRACGATLGWHYIIEPGSTVTAKY